MRTVKHTITIDMILIFIIFIFFSIFIVLRGKNTVYGLKRLLQKNEKERILFNLLSMESLCQMILKLYYTLESSTRTDSDPKLRSILLKAKPQAEMLETCRLDWKKIKTEIETENSESSYFKAKEHIHKLNHSITHAGVSILDVVEQFSTNFRKASSGMNISQKHLATLIYYLSNTIPMISDFSDSSNQFSRTIIKEVISLFEEIAHFSMEVTKEIQTRMQELMDENRNDSLVYIIQQTHTLVTDFEEFFHSLENLKNVSNHFVDSSIEKLNNIAEFAVSIEDIAETIKVISLNVSIEAANTGSSARGFQVLARDLREFAQKTLKFAGDVKAKVQDTIDSTSELKGDYLDNMNTVYDFVKEMKESIVNFKNIIEASFEKIQSIILVLQEFAHKVDSGLKHIIGKLQYYDITSQEIEHLSVFIEEIFNTAQKGRKEIELEGIVTSEDRRAIQVQILENIEKIITTKNERAILQKYKDMYDINVTHEGGSGQPAGDGFNTSEDESIILF